MRELRVICAATLCLLGQAAFAGYDEALAALHKKDYATAHPELLIAANKGAQGPRTRPSVGVEVCA